MEELNFNNHIIQRFYLGDVELIFTETMRNTTIICSLLILFAIFARICISKFEDVPKGAQNALEAVVELFNALVESCVGKKYSFFGNWFFCVFLYVIVSNYVGMLGLRPPTADLAITMSLALVTFVLVHITGLAVDAKSYFKGFFQPFIVFFPLNVAGFVAQPISLSFRLFGNILGGTIIMTLIYAALPAFLRWIIPSFASIYFDVFVGAIQATVFVMLSMLFISDMLPGEEA